MTTSPMLAASLPCIKIAKQLGRSPTEAEIITDLKKLNWAVKFLGSPKIDGIRGIVRNGVLISRTYKPIPNRYAQERFGRSEFNGLDGELTLGHHSELATYSENQSAIMTVDGPSNIWFNVFDKFDEPNLSFETRLFQAKKLVDQLRQEFNKECIIDVEHTEIKSVAEALVHEEFWVNQKYEGYMIRNSRIGYKFNRSTFNEQGLIKLKRFEDAEAEIIGFVELNRNTNEPTTDVRGFRVRSSHLAGKVGADTLGLFQVRDCKTGIEFECGSGLNDATRAEVWQSRDKYLGKIIKYKSQSHGVKEKPRSPIYLGIRSKEDM